MIDCDNEKNVFLNFVWMQTVEIFVKNVKPDTKVVNAILSMQKLKT